MLFKGNKKGKMMSESLFFEFICLFFVFCFFTVVWTMENNCFRVCLIFHFINRLFALLGSSISLYLSGTSMVVVVFSYDKVLLNVKRLFFFIYTVTIRSFLISSNRAFHHVFHYCHILFVIQSSHY